MDDDSAVKVGLGATEWSMDGLLRHFKFVHEKMQDHAFAWFLGAGASKASGIPTGGELVQAWLEELHERHAPAGVSLDKWATADALGIKGFDYADAAGFYPRVYERRFRDNPDEGYAYLESRMSNIDPSPGYSYLAKILERTEHRVVVTTNFDNLVADSLQIYSDTFPFVCGHESLTGFVRTAMRRPLVCKIHRDLLLGPRNDSRGLKRLHEAWAGVLRALLCHYTPIFVGYGGNDDSLMDLLESLEPGEIRGQLIWCYREGSTVKPRIRELVIQHRGVLVGAPEFDVLMALLGHQIGIRPLDSVLQERAQQRLSRYKERLLKLDTTRHPLLAVALAETFENMGGWWAWELKARAEPIVARREVIYRQGLDQCPNSYQLACNLAIFLWDELRRPGDARDKMAQAIEIVRGHPEAGDRSVVFVEGVRLWLADSTRADQPQPSLEETLEVLRQDQDWPSATRLAAMLVHARRFEDEAERLLTDAVAWAPTPAATPTMQLPVLAGLHIGVGAVKWIRGGDTKEIEASFRLALEIDASEVNAIANLACLLLSTSRDAEAEPLLEQAWEKTELQTNQVSAELAVYRGLAMKAKHEDDTEAVERLVRLLDQGFERSSWSFTALLTAFRGRVSSDDLAIYEVCAAAILDAARTPEAQAALELRLGLNKPALAQASTN